MKTFVFLPECILDVLFNVNKIIELVDPWFHFRCIIFAKIFDLGVFSIFFQDLKTQH